MKKLEAQKKARKATNEMGETTAKKVVKLSIEDLDKVNGGGMDAARQQGLAIAQM